MIIYELPGILKLIVNYEIYIINTSFQRTVFERRAIYIQKISMKNNLISKNGLCKLYNTASQVAMIPLQCSNLKTMQWSNVEIHIVS